MTNHLKEYAKCNGYDDPQDIICEVTGRPARDVHHLDGRGMGGSKLKDTCENLQALDRKIHNFDESHPHLHTWFKLVHKWWRDQPQSMVRLGYMEVHPHDPYGCAMVGLEVLYNPPGSSSDLYISNFGHIYTTLPGKPNLETPSYAKASRIGKRIGRVVIPADQSQHVLGMMSRTFCGGLIMTFFDENHENLNILNLVPTE